MRKTGKSGLLGRLKESCKDSKDHDDETQEEEEAYEPDELAKKTLNMLKGRKPMALREAVAVASSSLGAKPEDVAKRIYALNEAKMLSIADGDPPKSLPYYLTSSYALWFWALLGLVCATVAVVYFSPGPLVYVRYALGSLFVLFLPGFALIELLYPKKTDLSQLERVALSIGLSLALVPLTGLVLNYTPWGIRLDPIVISLSLLTVALAAGAAVRKFGYLRLSQANVTDAGKLGAR